MNFPAFSKYQYLVYGAFLTILFSVAVANVVWGINLSGMAAMTVLPWPGNAVVAWMLYFGFAIAAAQICHWEYVSQGRCVWGFAIVFTEACVASISIFSRGLLVFHLLPLLMVIFFNMKVLKIGFGGILLRLAASGLAVVLSVACVNMIRAVVYDEGTTVFDVYDVSDLDVYLYEPYELNYENPVDPSQSASPNPENHKPVSKVELSKKQLVKNVVDQASADSSNISTIVKQVSALVIGRWVGIEGVLSVQSYEGKSVALLTESLTKRPVIGEVDIYNQISKSGYSPSMTYVFSAIPGPVAAFYYSGKLWTVFLGIAFFSLFLCLSDLIIYRLFSNPFLSALLAFNFALAFAQFGLAPRQLIISLAMTVTGLAFLYFVDKNIARKNG
ncbi:MAG: hypothetical protein EOP04_21590 [Proteobacteria bacterium]|nr:MAG: hypothetical protein EOP04_21590 [Pseudomonadota bacterium]